MKRALLYAVLAMAAATFIYPFLWMAATTFKLHIILSVILYALLALHVWSGFYFGLRWWT